MKFHIETMTCGGCARGVTKAIQSIDAGAGVLADPPSRMVEIRSTQPREALLQALAKAGFPAVAA